MILVVALVFALGIPAYYVFIKKRASASLDDLLAERFRAARACPVQIIDVPQGGRVTCQAAYEDTKSDLILVLGSWARGTIKIPGAVADVDNKVAGVYKANAPADWLAHARGLEGVIVAAEAPGGAVVIWQGLPSRDSVLAHVEAVK